MRHLTTRTKMALIEAMHKLAGKGIVRPNISLSDDDMGEILDEIGDAYLDYETFWQDAKGYLEDLVAEGKFDTYLSEFHKSRRNPIIKEEKKRSYQKLQDRLNVLYRELKHQFPDYHWNHVPVWTTFWEFLDEIENGLNLELNIGT